MSYAVAIRVRLLASVLSLLLVVAAITAGGFWWLMRRGLPRLDGTARLPGLSAPVAVTRDALGVPTIRGETRADVARALGYVHAQDRFFQMDLLRRRAAGELAELFGKSAVPIDRLARVHAFRSLARKALALLPPDQRALAEAYTAGVNAGLASLPGRPFEYYVLHAVPRPWAPEDTMLVGYSMVLELQDPQDQYERMLAAIQDRYGRTMLDFVAPRGFEIDAALDGSTVPLPTLPGPDVINLRRRRLSPEDAGGGPRRARDSDRDQSRGGLGLKCLRAGRSPNRNRRRSPGERHASPPGRAEYLVSSFAGVERRSGRYQVASIKCCVPDPKFQIPNPKRQIPNRQTGVTGVTLPGIPLVIAGSNGHIAWGFTNSYADTEDVVIVEPSSIDPLLYKRGNDMVLMDERHETIAVKGGDAVDAVANWTVWGPVIGQAEHGRSLALHWVFDDPASLSLNLVALETAADVPSALALAPTLGIPAQNLIVAGRSGEIGWTIAGRLPSRAGYDGRLPAVWAYGDRRWNGYLPGSEYPRILSPASGQLWSANNRPVGGEDYAKLGDGGFAGAARARQIRDDLAAIKTQARPRDLLAVQLDDRALLLTRWKDLFLETLTPAAISAKPDRAVLRSRLETWNGRASVDSSAYLLVRRWRDAVAERALLPIFAPCREEYDRFDFHRLNYEEPLWRLMRERPIHFLSPHYRDWNDLLLTAADDVLRWVARQDRPIARLTWGTVNTARIEHPFSRFLPFKLARFLNMPADPLPGDHDMPRVQGPSFGASERFAVSPGHEDEGIFEMPGGQSGNPLSPFYRAGHEAWVRGEPTPFLPGPTTHTLTLEP